MKTESRIASILRASTLDYSITGFPNFDLSELSVDNNLAFELPSNLRLGHMVEKIVSSLIKSSSNYQVIYENLQVIQEGKTIGEIDFILKEKSSSQLTHLELAYKFYLYDPTLSSEPLNNWIGPNRNDSLREKVEKLKTKQFPMLHREETKSILRTIDINEVSQKLCLMASLFIPYQYKGNFCLGYEKAIKGYYLNLEQFSNHDNSSKTYCLPAKRDWGIAPSENENWTAFERIHASILSALDAKQAPLCWQNHNGDYSTFFIVWW